MTIRTLIVDDEPLARASISILLREHADVEVVGECGSGREAVSLIRELNPDLVFLDVQMPEIDGFDVLEQVTPPAVIFVTAYDQHALKAFEVAALDYLLKPFGNARFNRALARAREALAHRSPGKPAPPLRLIIKSAGRVAFLRTDEIDWIEAADYYVSLHVGGKSHLIRRALADLEQDLDPAMFCRVHRSAIVNLSRVVELRIDTNGENEVVLEDGTCLRVSRSYRQQLQVALGARAKPSAS